MKIGTLVLSFLAFAGTQSRLPAQDTKPVWQIGSFDRSSNEFTSAIPKQDPIFIVGSSKPSQDWYRFQPAVSSSTRPDPSNAPRSIRFTVSGKPATAYRLRIALLIEQSSVPTLRIGVNGRVGTFFLHPKLDYSMGDMMAAFFPAYSHADLVFNFPGNLLKSGENTISLQALSTGDKGVPEAGFVYDALALETANRPDGVTVSIEPTIFFQKSDGHLSELVDVFVRYSARLQKGEVDLAIGGKHYKEPLKTAQDFGDERLRIQVAEFPAMTSAHVSVSADGHRTQLQEVLAPQKKWTLFLVPHVHLDVGFSDYQSKVSAIQSRMFDEAMDLTVKHPDFRFSTDGVWNLEQYLKTRTTPEKQRVIEAIQRQQIYLPAQASNLLTGFPTAETLIRSLYPGANFSREHGTPFNYANITDVPSYSWSYASILASAGIPYFFAGSNNDRAPVLLQGHLNQNSPVYWEGPDGAKVLLWYSRHYMQMQFLFGLPPLTQTGEEMLPLFLQMYSRPGYLSDGAIIFGTQVENTDLFPQQSEIAGQWNALYAFPHVQYSGFYGALDSIAKQFGNSIPNIRGDGGPYWEDGIGSDAVFAAMERNNESRGPSAEKFATISTLVNPRLAVDSNSLSNMWADMVLMDEHTWTSWNSVSDPTSREAVEQLEIKESRAQSAHSLCEQILQSSLASIADSITAPADSLILFNALNWKRDGVVQIDLNNDQELVDRSSGKSVPFHVLSNGNDYRRVEFLARDVPAVGYKVYTLRAADKVIPAVATEHESSIESPYYRVELDPSSGAVRSIFDKQLNKELVDTHSPYRFGQYLYVTGGDQEPNSILQYRVVSPKPDLQIHGSEQGRILSVEPTSYGTLARLTSSSLNTPEIVTEIRLFNGVKRIQFDESFSKKEVLTKEAVYFAFPFAMDNPEFHYEVQTGVVDPAKDMYPGAGREWFSAQHWASVQQDGMSGTVMPLDSALITLGDINRGAWPTEFGKRGGTIFSYALNNYWHTNYRAAQGGEFKFRFVVTSAAATDPVALSRAGWEAVTPLEVDQISTQDKALDLPRPLDGKQSSFLLMDDPALLLETWKPAEDGDGMILRFLDLGGTKRIVTASLPQFTLDKVTLTDSVERNRKPLVMLDGKTFQFEIGPHELRTVRIAGKSILLPPAN